MSKADDTYWRGHPQCQSLFQEKVSGFHLQNFFHQMFAYHSEGIPGLRCLRMGTGVVLETNKTLA
jgi:hypothetical protein